MTTHNGDDLGTLFNLAREYGRVIVFTQKDCTYCCDIYFDTIDHVELKAGSGFNHDNVCTAVAHAINAAQSIIDSLKSIKPDVDTNKTLLLMKYTLKE